jgi:hypothetical protein
MEGELIIEIRPRACVTWEGSAEQLKAEDLIPEGFEWPVGRKADKSWTDEDGFAWWLRKCRPRGAKGPQGSFDHWALRRSFAAEKGQGWAAASIYEAQLELQRARWRTTHEALRLAHRCVNAHSDAAFQAFLVNVGAIKPRKTRERKAAVSEGR